MDKQKIFKSFKYFIYTILVSSFLVIYFASKNGYFDEIKSQRVALTKEQIAKFEEDVALGKELDLKDYYIDTKEKYNNKISELGKFLSSHIENILTKILDKSFKALNDFLNS